MKGYVEVPQFWYYAKTWEELIGEPKGDAKAFTDVVAPQRFNIVDYKPSPSFGHIVFRVEDDGKLTFVSARYDSSG